MKTNHYQQMKKALILLICLLTTVAAWAQSFNYFFRGSELKYEIINKDAHTCEVTGWVSIANNVIIPESVSYLDESYTVTKLERAFDDCSSLTSVTIPNSVTSIGESAFAGCSSLTSVTIPNSVTSIGNDAFRNCFSLTSVTIPNSVTSIGWNAFMYCSSLTSVTISNSVTFIGSYAFSNCNSLSSVTIPNSVTTIGIYAFSGCSSLTSVTIPNSVTTISDYAFYGCSSLTSVTIPNSVTTIKYGAFDSCYSLTSVTIPNSVTSIGWNAFMYCSSLTSVTIPNSVTTIGDYAFYCCSSLTSIIIPNSVTSISAYTFMNCRSLTSVTIPNSITEIGEYAFSLCSSLTSITIPNSVTTIGEKAFFDCSGLTEIFYGAKNPIVAPDDVFSNYKNPTLYVRAEALNKMYITKPWAYFENIETYDFSGITLDSNSLSLYVGDKTTLKVTEDGNLSELTWTSSNPEVATVDSNGTVTAIGAGTAVITVSGTDLDTNNTVSATCNVQVIEKWKYTLTYTYNSASSATVTGISIMEGMENVDVEIPESTEKDGRQYTVTGIDASAFAGNSLLRSVTIPSTVNDIDPGAFKGCANLETVNYYPVSVNTTNDHHANPVFSNCPKFKNLNIGGTVKEISKFIFKCTDIETVDIPDNVEALRNDCFADCYKLSDIKIGRGVTTIDCAAFAFGSSSDLSTKIYCNAREITYYRGLNYSSWKYMPFNNRHVSSIEFGPDVERLDDYAFSDVRPSDIYCDGTTPPVVANDIVLKSVNKSSCTLHVPAGSLQLYKTADFWKDFYNIKGDIKGAAYTLSYSFDSATSTATVTGITVQDGVDNIDVEIPETIEHEGRQYTVTTIGDNAFTGCASLTSVTIPSSVTTIGNYAFQECSSLSYVNIPDSVKYIGSFAFSFCLKLNSITIPSSVTTIGERAFRGCTKLVAINVDTENQNYCSINGILFNKDKTTLYYYPAGKSDLNYEIPNSVKTIGREAFYYSSLTSVTIPNSVTTIGECAFYCCKSLTSVTIPDSVTKIDINAFNSCYSLTSVTIPNSVTTIGWGTFEYCNSLLSVTIPNSVTEIGGYAFAYCSNLTSITIPNSVTEIEESAFWMCNSLSSITIPNAITTIGWGTFAYCNSLTSITIPTSVTTITEYAFFGCNSLEKVYYGAEEPITASEDVFSDYSKPTLYVKESALEKIKITTPWSLFENIETYDFAGINDPTVDGDGSIDYAMPYDVYDLNGIKVADTLDGLRPGFYIVRQGARTGKTLVR